MATPPPTSYRSSPPSSYGERPALYGPRRSFTAPHRRLSHHEKAGLDDSDASAEILYSHPSTRIIKFTPSTTGIPLSSKPLSVDTDYPVDAIEVLPWAASTESLLATGLLKIEKVRGSTNFLKCKDVHQPILRNSQCWLVDGMSKFVLRVGKLQYYRIELPANTTEDTRRVEDFKEALRKILRFEVTPCPFKRGFHVELADSALTPRRKGQWKRREGSLPSSPLNATTPPLRHKTRMWQPRASSSGLGWQEELRPSRVDSGYGQSPTDEHEKQEIQTRGSAVHGQSESEEESDPETRTLDEVGEEIKAMLSPTIAMAPEFEIEEKIMTPIKVSDTPSVEGDTNEELEEESPGAEIAPSPVPSPIIEAAKAEEPTEPPSIPEMPHEESLSPPLETPEHIHSKSPTNSLGIPHSLANSQESLLFSLLLADTRRPPQPFPENDFPSRHDSEELALLPEPSEDGANTRYGRRPTLESMPDDVSIAESTDSFHTSASVASDLNIATPKRQTQYDDGPTPLAEPREHDLWSPQDRSHRRDISEMTITASTFSSPDLPKAELHSSDAHPSSPIIQSSLRHRVKARRSLSPLPPSSTIVRSNTSAENNHIAAVILQKAASVAFVKPAELVVLIVHILARIAGGATMNDLMSGDLFRKPPRERARTQSMSLPDGIPNRHLGISEDEDEDDYGVPIRGRTRSGDSSMGSPEKGLWKDNDTESVADSLADLD
jgi:hypothetical protein